MTLVIKEIHRSERNLYEFYWKYSSNENGLVISSVSEKSKYLSESQGLRLTVMEILKFLSSRKSQLDISEISKAYDEALFSSRAQAGHFVRKIK